jgi:hypothetical protein
MVATVTAIVAALQQQQQLGGAQNVGTNPPAPGKLAAEEEVTYLPVDVESPWFPLGGGRQVADVGSGRFRVHSYAPEPWATALADKPPALHEAQFTRSLALYLSAPAMQLAALSEAAQSADADTVPLSEYSELLGMLAATVVSVHEAAGERAAYLEVKAKTRADDPEGEVAHLEAVLSHRHRALPATGSRVIDEARLTFREDVGAQMMKVLAKTAAQKAAATARGVAPVRPAKPKPRPLAGGSEGSIRGGGGRSGGGAPGGGAVGGRGGGRGGGGGGRGRGTSIGAELASPAGASAPAGAA